jgi:hypothetical protein
MARLNIEDQFWLDAMAIMGGFANQDEAIGNAVRFFRYAQDKHKNGEYLSEEEFERLGFSRALIPQFAIVTEHGIMARGADQHFGWLKARVEAGRKGGSKTKQIQANETKSKQPKASSSYSPSSSDSGSVSNSYDAAAGFERVWNEFKSLPGVVKGAKAFDRFEAQVKSPKDEHDLINSICFYKETLSIQTWRTPKVSLETYLGTERSGFFWREFTQRPANLSANAPRLISADVAAAKILEAMKKIGESDSDGMKAELGDELWAIYRAAGGRSQLGRMDPTDFRFAIKSAVAARGAMQPKVVA